MPGKFELYKDVGGRFRFRLTGESGERVLVSDGYAKKVLALEAIVSVLKMAPEATLIDLTVAGNSEILLSDDTVEDPEKTAVSTGSQPLPRKRAPARKRVTKKATAGTTGKQARKSAASPAPSEKKKGETPQHKKKKKNKKSKKEKKQKSKHKKKH